MSISWTRDGKRIWYGSNGMILTNQSFTISGVRIKCFFVYQDQAARYRGEHIICADSVAEAKQKAGEHHEH